MGCIIGGTGVPASELNVWVPYVRSVVPTDAVPVQEHSQLREPFVHPGLLIPIQMPMDHVLELMCQHAIGELIGEVQIVCAEIEHLVLVGVLVDQGGVRILR